MLRSLISLMMLANVSAAPDIAPIESARDFNAGHLLAAERIPVEKPGAAEPTVRALAGLVMDARSGMVLYEKNAHDPLPMASLTKIMTAMLILDSHKLGEVVTVDENYNGVPGVKIWLKQYEKITVGDLLIGLLVPSGGDAALALAKYHSGSEEAFVNAMNEKAQKLNLKNTRFKNPIGLDEEGHYASAYDLALLSKYAMRNPYFRNIVGMPHAEIFSIDRAIRHAFENTNKLLGTYLNILGVKTGTTDAAGESIINLARNQNGDEVIAVILNSPDRFGENKRLIEWAFDNFLW